MTGPVAEPSRGREGGGSSALPSLARSSKSMYWYWCWYWYWTTALPAPLCLPPARPPNTPSLWNGLLKLALSTATSWGA